MSVQQVFIVRHGETDYNAAHRWQGHLDIPLNAAGQEQARLVGEYLKSQAIDAIYSSDLRRAYDTARSIAHAKGLTIHKEPRLREINVGVFQGLNRAQILEMYAEEFSRWDSDDAYVVEKGESRLILQQRAYAAWQDIVENGHRESVVLVTHGGTMRMLLRKLLGDDRTPELKFPNTSVTMLEKTALALWQAVQIASVEHLKELK